MSIPLLLLALFFILTLLFPLPKSRIFPPVSTVIQAQDGQVLRIFTARDEMWRVHTDFREISLLHQRLVLAYEDQWFYWHPGINPIAIFRAAITNFKAGRVLVGGSTITMQIARMIERKPRNVTAKIIEAFRALQLELNFSKNELLEIYFNLAPYGGNIEGVGAAAALYFGKLPAALSIGEIALLTALPNSPTFLRPDKHPEAALAARNKVLHRLRNANVITQSQLADALSEPVPAHRRPVPFLAPHFCDYLKQKYPNSSALKTTLDLRMQTICQNSLTEYIRGLQSKEITNGAVVVIDNATHRVKALVGSADFFNAAHAGQVNGAVAPRSPGSALKPFVYALALDAGLISQKSILEDVPVDYAGYEPENYDARYHGVVTVEQALAQSLNVPAVNLTATLKDQSLYALLKKARFTSLNHPENYYGLPIILGGCEVKLLELCALYASLANQGKFFPAKILVEDTLASPTRLFSSEAAFIITEILTRHERPDLPTAWEFTLNLPKVAWKTGTSYGHKDAWSVGFTPDLTIGVWVGNFSGKGVPELVGADAAAPLLFDLFNAFGGPQASGWFEMPPGLGVRSVCALSGMPVSDICPAAIEEFYIPGVSPSTKCTIHQKIAIDKLTGHSLCPHCRQNRDFEEKIFARWPSKLATWMARNGYPIDKIPSHLPQCTSLVHGAPPSIRSPSADCDYVLREGVDPEFQKILLDASVANDVRKIYWFFDGTLLHTCSPKDKVFYLPTPGRHKLVCMDELGRSTEISLNVK